jgi:hypothetical protein
MISDNPQIQGNHVALPNVEVLGIEPQEKEGKTIYFLKLECHKSSYLCTAQNKETSEIYLMKESNKEIKVNLEMSKSSTMGRTGLRLCS